MIIEATRQAYGQGLIELGNKHHNLVVLDAGTSNSTYSFLFAEKFPKRYFPMFIAEQNMVGVAVGLAKRGYAPFISSFAAFFTRAHDQLRMASYSQANIKICGSHCGVSIGQDGVSQMGLEDIAMFRSIYGATVLYPSDAVSTIKLMELAFDINGLIYLRTTRAKTPIIYNQSTQLTIPGLSVLKHNPDDSVAVITAGITLHEALAAFSDLEKRGKHIRIIDLYCLKPIEQKQLQAALGNVKNVITVEDHYLEGGLGEAVKTTLSGSGFSIKSLAVNKLPKSGQPSELLSYEMIDKKAIIDTVDSLL